MASTRRLERGPDRLGGHSQPRGRPCLALALICVVSGGAAETSPHDRAAAIFMRACTACHGAAADGGHKGRYPRLAGLPAPYIVRQLESFRDRKRVNKPMIPIFKGGRLTQDDIETLADYLSRQPIPSPAEVGVPEQISGDLTLGESLYAKGCAECHGQDGRGQADSENPPVVSQWPAYLIKQMIDFRTGQRIHENQETLFAKAESPELDALLAYMLHLNRRPPSPPAP